MKERWDCSRVYHVEEEVCNIPQQLCDGWKKYGNERIINPEFDPHARGYDIF